MDIILLIAVASITAILLLAISFYFKAKQEDKVVNRPRPAPNRIRDGVPRRAQMQRNRGVRLRANAAREEQESEEEQEPAEAEDNGAAIDGKIGAKKRAKLEAKAEKKAHREAEEQARQEKKKRQQLAEEEKKKLEEKQLAEEKQREAEEQRAREEKEKQEHEEYLRMKEAFSVEEEGYEEGEAGDEQNLLQEFVNYIKQQKVVVIEDLAAHFKLKTQATIDRIKDLQKDDILSGVIDDRGKFIYVSQQEIDAVAKFIRQRGRVSIAEIAENSHNLISLVPTTTVNS